MSRNKMSAVEIREKRLRLMRNVGMMGFLDEIRKTAEWEEEGPGPEVFHVGNRIHYIAPLTFRRGNSKETGTFCFSLVLEGGQWYFQQLEGIFIRLDKIGEPPVSSFPDLSDERKAWIRDEIQISKDVRLFAHLSREKGKDALPSTGSKTVAATPYRHKCGCPSCLPTGPSFCMSAGTCRI